MAKSRTMTFAEESDAYDYVKANGITNYTIKATQNGWRLDWYE